MLKLRFLTSIFATWLVMTGMAMGSSSPSGNAARVVAWQAKPGMSRDFELGYRRHLEWHRAHDDAWTWHGWSIVSGPRTGYFVDGTFFHPWADFDAPVAPAQDAADNEVNVAEYATLQSVAAYESVEALSRFDAAQLQAPLITFTYIEVMPGRAAELESLIATRDRAASPSFLLLRPIAGTHEYLLMLPARTQPELAAHAAFTQELLARVAARQGSSPIVKAIRTETGRHRADLSYLPGAH